MRTQTVKYRGVDLEVHYTITGNDITATYYTPPEFEETNIKKITLQNGDLDIIDIFDNDQLNKIHELLIEKL